MDSSKQRTAAALAALTGALLLAAVDRAVASVEADKQASADRGQKMFVTTCSFCHGAQAKGGEGGPDLLRSVLVLDDVDGDKIGPVILGGRRDRGMPQFALTPAQISDIASFLHHSIDAAAERKNYQILNIVTGDPKTGEAYFNGPGKCNTCHSVTGDLKGIGGKYDPVTLQGMILMPSNGPFQRGHEGARFNTDRTVTVTFSSGQVFQGELEHIDDFNVALRDSSGNYRSFTRKADSPVVEVHDPLQAHSDMLTKYTDAEIHNLTAYLVNLK
jgi:mono/diheme cytochrome c family protein/small nuclear ribonucleoprotein (snRNP)-like protein